MVSNFFGTSLLDALFWHSACTRMLTQKHDLVTNSTANVNETGVGLDRSIKYEMQACHCKMPVLGHVSRLQTIKFVSNFMQSSVACGTAGALAAGGAH